MTVVGIGQLRDSIGMDEAGGLDVAQAGTNQTVDEPQLVGSVNNDSFVLQAVARANLIDLQEVVHTTSLGIKWRRKNSVMAV